jgi:hypothetical protein
MPKFVTSSPTDHAILCRSAIYQRALSIVDDSLSLLSLVNNDNASARSLTHSHGARMRFSTFLEHFITFTDARATAISISTYGSSASSSSPSSPLPPQLLRGLNNRIPSKSSMLSLQLRTQTRSSLFMVDLFPLGNNLLVLLHASHTALALHATLLPSSKSMPPISLLPTKCCTSDAMDAQAPLTCCLVYILNGQHILQLVEKRRRHAASRSLALQSNSDSRPSTAASLATGSAALATSVPMYSLRYTNSTDGGRMHQWDIEARREDVCHRGTLLALSALLLTLPPLIPATSSSSPAAAALVASSSCFCFCCTVPIARAHQQVGSAIPAPDGHYRHRSRRSREATRMTTRPPPCALLLPPFVFLLARGHRHKMKWGRVLSNINSPVIGSSQLPLF